jgi:hypothetical protein
MQHPRPLVKQNLLLYYNLQTKSEMQDCQFCSRIPDSSSSASNSMFKVTLHILMRHISLLCSWRFVHLLQISSAIRDSCLFTVTFCIAKPLISLVCVRQFLISLSSCLLFSEKFFSTYANCKPKLRLPATTTTWSPSALASLQKT